MRQRVSTFPRQLIDKYMQTQGASKVPTDLAFQRYAVTLYSAHLRIYAASLRPDLPQTRSIRNVTRRANHDTTIEMSRA